ncbi:glycosyl transferase [Domibacillus sp. PGB-M46]|uniref:glycosyltransferase family 32 protein n=1 Tax=Domibacillus sp. PGB-M46 TaxID=2910255 RepID=UPI001F55BE4D|nr:glycosyltransferase [Domibacillus sp. PGB-M46]MCI2255192.1 glycosyl transferase [Domibacillus sp. PGB-M46]
MEFKIPKIIHYCWFGKGQKPKAVIECINSWKKQLPDYRIIEWNENNFDINSNKYVQKAYLSKKYAFVSDYVRLHALYHHGGIYMDTDVEVIKNLDAFLNQEAFSGFESNNYISAGILGSIRNHPWIKRLLFYYENVSFEREDGSLDTTTNTMTITAITNSEYGLKFGNYKQILNIEGNKVNIYPSDYFCAKDWKTKILNVTENTYTIHHFAGSWLPKKTYYEKMRAEFKTFSINAFKNILGEKTYIRFKKVFQIF